MTTGTSSDSHTDRQSTFGLVLDIDGVFIRDGIPIEESFEALRLIVKYRIPFVFVTNGGGDLEQKRIDLMQELFQDAWGDYKLQLEQMVLAHTPMSTLAQEGAECHEKRVLVLSWDREPGMRVLESYGFKPENLIHVSDLAEKHPFALPYQHAATERTQELHRASSKNPLIIDAVVAVSLVDDWHVTLQLLLDILMHDGTVLPPSNPYEQQQQREKQKPDTQDGGEESALDTHRVKLFISNPDIVYAGQMNNRLTQGAFIECLSHLYGTLTNGKNLDVSWFGKPHASTYHFARERLQHLAQGRKLRTVYGIGDNPKSDIRGANNAKQLNDGLKWQSVLVRTGVFPPHLHNDQDDPADIVEDNILTAVQQILKREGIVE